MLDDILEEHRDEAAALFDRRLYALSDLELDTADLEELDARIRAHLGGLALGGSSAWELARAQLDGGTAGDAFVPMNLALDAGRPEQLDDLAAVADAQAQAQDGATFEGLLWACRLSASASAEEWLWNQLRSGSAGARALALDALSYRGIDVSPVLTELPEGPPALQGAALRAAGRARRGDLAASIEACVLSGPEALRSDALESLVLVDPARGRELAVDALAEELPHGAAGAELLGCLGLAADRPLLERGTSSQDPALARASILSLGNLGVPEALPALIEHLDDPHRAGAAGVALARILGPECLVDVDAIPLPSFDDDDDLSWRDDDIPRPSRVAVQVWLDEHRARFSAGVRYRNGAALQLSPPSRDSLLGFVRSERLECALVSPGEPLGRVGATLRL